MNEKTGSQPNYIRHLEANPYFANDALFETIKEHEKRFSRKLEFPKELSYDEKHKIWHQRIEECFDDFFGDDLLDNIEKGDAFFNFLSEPVRNIADHSNSNGYIDIQYIEDPLNKKFYLHFSILDDGDGFGLNEKQLTTLRHSGDFVNMPGWKKVGKENTGAGLGFIKHIAQYLNIDLQLHNKGSIFPINNLGLQPHIKPSEKFGYEGYGVFDMK